MREKATRRRRGGGGGGGGGVAHQKRLTSVLCVLSVATAVSVSAEHKSHQGESSGPAGKTQEREKVSECTKTLLHNILMDSINSLTPFKMSICHSYLSFVAWFK